MRSAYVGGVAHIVRRWCSSDGGGLLVLLLLVFVLCESELGQTDVFNRKMGLFVCFNGFGIQNKTLDYLIMAIVQSQTVKTV